MVSFPSYFSCEILGCLDRMLPRLTVHSANITEQEEVNVLFEIL